MFKYCFVDFDNALCVTLYHHRDPEVWFRMLYEQSNCAYDNIDFKPLPCLYDYLTELKTKGCEIQMLSVCSYSYVCDCQMYWVCENYPNLVSRGIGVFTPEAKLEFLEKFAHMTGCLHDDILLIDSDPRVIAAARARAFVVISPGEIAINQLTTARAPGDHEHD